MENNPFKSQPRIEIVRSFSKKINLGNYESFDVFASAKMECDLADASSISAELFDFAKNEALASIVNFRREMQGLAQLPEGEAVQQVEQRAQQSASRIASRTPASAPQPASIDQYFVEEKAPAAAQAQPLKQQVDDKMAEAKKACEEMAGKILGTVKGAKKKEHLTQFYMGWFGVPDTKQLPKNPAEYHACLQALLNIVTNDANTHSRFLENPRAAGEGVRQAYNERMAGTVEPRSHAPSSNGHATSPDDAMSDDPLIKHFGWRSMETAQYAKSLMGKWGHKLEDFDKHLTFLNMKKLEEEDLLALLKMLYFGPDNAYGVWKKAQGKEMPLRIALNMVNRHLGGALGMNTPPAEAAKAMVAAMGDLT